jgi:hypothetical protein
VVLPHGCRSGGHLPDLAAAAAKQVMNEPRLHMLLGPHPNLVACHGYWLERLEKTYAPPLAPSTRSTLRHTKCRPRVAACDRLSAAGV